MKRPLSHSSDASGWVPRNSGGGASGKRNAVPFSKNRRLNRRRWQNNNKTNNERGANLMGQAHQVEQDLILALDRMQQVVAHGRDEAERLRKEALFGEPTAARQPTKSPPPPPDLVAFPSVRDCNAALATFGDGGDFLRALRTFAKMRKAVALVERLSVMRGSTPPPQQQQKKEGMRAIPQPPAPTLVTYSTLMSRAVQLGKARVALRLWKFMTLQQNVFAPATPLLDFHNDNNNNHTSIALSGTIVPDVRSANILMNAYAKLGDVASARDLLNQMLSGNGTDVPQLQPNLVTFNTLLDACHRAGSMDDALEVYDALQLHAVVPDVRTFTSLVGTVARRSSLRGGGVADPDMAFYFVEQEMKLRWNLQPNGWTYCALIDVCGRCRRSDLALKGLRIMLRQKSNHGAPLENEVGAWTAAINACGKTGRIDTAVKLFWTMVQHDNDNNNNNNNATSTPSVKPNAVTCACLTDCLLNKSPLPRIADVMNVLRYMKKEHLEPSKIMYTSLMTCAGRLVQVEKEQRGEAQDSDKKKKDESLLSWDESSIFGPGVSRDTKQRKPTTTTTAFSSSFAAVDSKSAPAAPRAVDLYAELMTSLARATTDLSFASSSSLPVAKGKSSSSPRSNNNNNDNDKDKDPDETLLKVFLVFAEMRAAGARPDVACYNALLRACARAGDVQRALDVLQRLLQDQVDPNHKTWRELLRAAAMARRSEVAESIWALAWSFRPHGTRATVGDESQGAATHQDKKNEQSWRPDADDWEALISAYVREADVAIDDVALQWKLYTKAIRMYTHVWEKSNATTTGIHLTALHEHARATTWVLRAVVQRQCLPARGEDDNKKLFLSRRLAAQLLQLDSFQVPSRHWNAETRHAWKIAKEWFEEPSSSPKEEARRVFDDGRPRP